MPHQAHSCLISCMDFRFIERIHQFFGQDQRLAGLYDHVSVAGSALSIARPKKESDREFIIEQVRLSVELHNIREVIIVNHQDGGAYGKFDSEQSERVRHETDLRKARQIIQEKFPGINVRLFYATLKEKGKKREIVFEEIK